MTRVSVCIPTYNGATYIAAALRSVLGQTFTDFELIVCDDASADDTLQVVETFRDDRLRVVRNPVRLGLVGNWNRCLELASGEYIALFHQDDVMRPDNLADKVAMLDANPGVGLVYSDIGRIDETGQVIGGHYIEQPTSTTIMPGSRLFAMAAATGNPVACPAVVVRAACYRGLGGFDARLPFAVDLEMWLRIASRYDIGYIARPLVAHRVHATQETGRFGGSGRDYQDILHALNIIYGNVLPLDCAQYAHKAYETLAHQAYDLARWQVRRVRPIPAARYLAVILQARRQMNIYPSHH